MLDSLTAHRRALHRIPELGDDLPETAAYVQSVLRALPCAVTTPTKCSVCAFFDAGAPDTAAFRADMDALPVAEETGRDFASCHPGRMHACGHDGHTAMLLTFAERLAARKTPPRHSVLLLFQPAEETVGGARPLCETGILERHHVSRVFGLHLWPGLPEGKLFTRRGAIMAKSSEVDVTFLGRGTHISRAEEGADSLLAGARFLPRAYALSAHMAEEGAPNLLKFGRLESGTARNAISARTVLQGSLRCFSPEVFARLRAEILRLAEAAAGETGCRAEVYIKEGYPAVVNDAALVDAIRAALGESAPAELPAPVTAGEDFSFYQQRVPGVFSFLGVGERPPLHAGNFDFDERALTHGVAFYERLLDL